MSVSPLPPHPAWTPSCQDSLLSPASLVLLSSLAQTPYPLALFYPKRFCLDSSALKPASAPIPFKDCVCLQLPHHHHHLLTPHIPVAWFWPLLVLSWSSQGSSEFWLLNPAICSCSHLSWLVSSTWDSCISVSSTAYMLASASLSLSGLLCWHPFLRQVTL